MSGSRKRRRDEGQNNAFKAKVHIVPVYSSQTGVVGNGSTLSLPCSLGRRNLAELWWKYCPNGCHAERPQAKPCTRFCASVRRKSHRSLLSREIVAIDASGNIDLRAKHPEIIRWSYQHKGTFITNLKRISPGEHYFLMIGDFEEEQKKPWMSFKVGLIPVVTPEHARNLKGMKEENSKTRRRLFNPWPDTTSSQQSSPHSCGSEISHHKHFTQLQHSSNADRSKRTALGSDQSYGDSCIGGKFGTQEDSPIAKSSPNLKRMKFASTKKHLISPSNQIRMEDRYAYNHTKHLGPTLQPRQLIFSGQSEIHPTGSIQSQERSGSISVVGVGSREGNPNQESALCLPGGETQNTHDERMLCYSESPCIVRPKNRNFQRHDQVDLQLSQRCRDWSLNDWRQLSRQKLASEFGRRMADLVLSKNMASDEGEIQLPSLFDDSTIGVPFRMVDKKPASSRS